MSKKSSEISALLTREGKAWKVIDYHLSLKNKIQDKVRQSAAEFVLERIYPKKMTFGGEDGSPLGEIKIIIQQAAPQKETNGNNVQAPRFAVPDIQ